ncbi:MAG TPA: FixH family protein [Myxococcota bacterium]|nr:FixH family protein [Myxococcota bacterium]
MPWYRYFWPWFMVALLGTSFAAGMLTLQIAFSQRDSLVSEHWYAEGERINWRLALEANAARRAIRAELRIDELTGEVRIDLEGEGTAHLRELMLRLEHPTRESGDLSVSLRRSDSGSFYGNVNARLAGSWYAQLAPAVDPPPGPETSHPEIAHPSGWRLSASLRLPSARPLRLGASG